MIGRESFKRNAADADDARPVRAKLNPGSWTRSEIGERGPNETQLMLMMLAFCCRLAQPSVHSDG